MLNSDETLFIKTLPIYQADDCLLGILKSIDFANKKNYNSDLYYYSLTFKKEKKYRYLVISAEKWEESKSLDFCGVLLVNNASFLLRGDINQDKVFKKTGSIKTGINLKLDKDSASFIPFVIEPVLQGTYFKCKGLPIYIEVYVQDQIPNFEMKLKHSINNRKPGQ
jgi:hypothetical protein